MSVQLGASGEAAKGISKAFATVFGPAAREFGEYLGDKVKYHRHRALIKILEKASEEKYFPEPNQREMPPLKFLVPFGENASLEEEDDELMIELWARLLAGSTNNYSSRHVIFMRILKEITSSEARFLDEMCRKNRSNYEFAPFSSVLDAPGWIEEPHLFKLFKDWSDKDTGILLRDYLLQRIEVPGTHVLDIEFLAGVRGEWPYDEADCDPSADQISWLFEKYSHMQVDVLRGLNIISEKQTGEIWYGNRFIRVSYLEITPLGAEFFVMCNGTGRID